MAPGLAKSFFAGTIHGNEKSATATLNSFIDQLEARAGDIPAHRTIIVIPNVNPDGYAANSRLNARGVDLNRNFPASNWKPGVTMPGGEYLPEGGGTAPLSEPESQALGSYVTSQSPRLVVSYHSTGGVAIANEAGDSLTIARAYARSTGFWALGNDSSAYFDYDTTGAFEDWLAQAYGIPAILIELSTRSGNEYSSQAAAMWDVVRL